MEPRLSSFALFLNPQMMDPKIDSALHQFGICNFRNCFGSTCYSCLEPLDPENGLFLIRHDFVYKACCFRASDTHIIKTRSNKSAQCRSNTTQKWYRTTYLTFYRCLIDFKFKSVQEHPFAMLGFHPAFSNREWIMFMESGSLESHSSNKRPQIKIMPNLDSTQ